MRLRQRAQRVESRSQDESVGLARGRAWARGTSLPEPPRAHVKVGESFKVSLMSSQNTSEESPFPPFLILRTLATVFGGKSGELSSPAAVDGGAVASVLCKGPWPNGIWLSSVLLRLLSVFPSSSSCSAECKLAQPPLAS